MQLRWDLGPLNRLTTRDIYAGAFALVALIGVIVILAIHVEVPTELWSILMFAAGYLFRGSENGGLRPRKDG